MGLVYKRMCSGLALKSLQSTMGWRWQKERQQSRGPAASTAMLPRCLSSASWQRWFEGGWQCSSDSTGERLKARAAEIWQPEDSWQNGLLTILGSVRKETEIGQISRAVMVPWQWQVEYWVWRREKWIYPLCMRWEAMIWWATDTSVVIQMRKISFDCSKS